MSQRSDEVYNGERCAVCEERLTVSSDVVVVNGTSERVHRTCWID